MFVKKVKTLLFITSVLIPLIATSQGGPPPPGDDPPVPAPIDNVCSALLVSGLFLAIYTVRKHNRKFNKNVNSESRPEY
jgi:hypothetical protein